jgi:hypothetical protein
MGFNPAFKGLNTHKYRSCVFRSAAIIRELVLNLFKVMFMLKHSVKLRRYMFFDDVAACHSGVCVVCCAAHNTHAALFSTNSLMMAVDRNV